MAVSARLAGAASVVVLFAVASPLALIVVVGQALGDEGCASPGPVPKPAGEWTAGQIAQLWVAEGGPSSQARIAGAVGMAESHGDPNVVNSIGATGLWQILLSAHPDITEAEAKDPETATRYAIKLWRAEGWRPWEAYTNGQYLQYMRDADGGTVAAVCPPGGTVEGSPKRIIDTVVLPMANRDGIPRTVAENDAANATHGPTVSGGRSDHQGPPDDAWAADMSNGITTPEEDKLAADLARRFEIPWHGFGLVSATHGGYRFQLIWRAEGHFDHVHFGIRRQ